MPLKKSVFIVYVLVILSMVFWGMSFVWTKIVFNYLGPLSTVFIRLLISSALLYAGLTLTGRLQKIKREHIGLLMLAALFNPFLYFVGESFGVKFSTPVISSVIIATIPVFSAITAVLFLRERLNYINVIGLTLSFAGILVMILRKDLSLSADPLGVACLLFAVLTAVSYSVILKKLAFIYSAFTIVTWQNIIGALYFLPFTLIFESDKLMSIRPDPALWTPLILLSVFASSFAFVFFTIGTRELGVSRTNVFSNFIPVFTAAFSYLLLGETLTPSKLAGIALVIAGVALSQVKRQNLLKRLTYSRMIKTPEP
jgi:drug/metabolite transporter (DMT)-like permease